MSALSDPLAAPRFVVPLVLRLAWRDLRGGLSGFGIFLACIALGVAAISGVGSVTRGLSDGLARQGRTILGGDIAFSLIHRSLDTAEAAFLMSRGTLSKIADLRAMARRSDGTAALVEIKAVGADYPSLGRVSLAPAMTLDRALAARDGVYGAAVDPTLLARLDIKLGDRLMIGEAPIEVRAILAGEPDKLGTGLGLGPRVLLSLDALPATALVQPGSLIRWTYRLLLPTHAGRPASDGAVAAVMDEVQKSFPDAGWEVRSRSNISPQFTKNIARFGQFLTLVGLTALIVGGIGVANAVNLYVERKRTTIATLKALGASASRIFLMMLVEVMLVALIGIAVGLVCGAALPFGVQAAFGAIIPFPLVARVYPVELGLGFAYGLLTALTFALLPLGRSHDVAATTLFRDWGDSGRLRLRPVFVAMMACAALALAGVAIGFASDRKLAAYYGAAMLIVFVSLRLLAAGLMRLAAALPRPRSTGLRLALGNIHRPGALTPTVVLSMGLGLTLLSALTFIEGNIRGELARARPGETPSFFFVDIPSTQAPAFDAFLRREVPSAKIERVPMMRGRILKIGGTRAEDLHAKENVAWVLDGDRGITYSATLPEGSRLAEGRWWPAGYSGPPLVSFDDEVARGLGVGIGATITVNVLGRTLTATIANLRTVDWRSFGINFVMVFSPSAFAGAPHSDLATLTLSDASPQGELRLVKDVAQAFPGITSVRVKDALQTLDDMIGKLALAIRGAAAVALAAAVLVLAGALAAGQRARIYDAVVLKTLGATRGRLLASYLIEYAMMGSATVLFGVLAGAGAADFVVSHVMQLDFSFLWRSAILTALGALVFMIGLGLIGTWRVLGQRPASFLRNL